MRNFRAWLMTQSEPSDFPLVAPCAALAAADMVRSMDGLNLAALESTPLPVLVRSEGRTLERCLVTSETLVRVWGYPDSASAEDAPSAPGDQE